MKQKFIIILFALTSTALGQEAKPNPYLTFSSGLIGKRYSPLNLRISCGNGDILINLGTGQVELPKGITLPDAAVAFWLRMAQCFPECRQAMLTGDPTPLTTMWGEDYLKAHPIFSGEVAVKTFHFVMLNGDRGGPSYELGLRSDGVVVWREVKP